MGDVAVTDDAKTVLQEARVAVACDGSSVSDSALTAAARLFSSLVSEGHPIARLHVLDRSKTYLPANLQPEHLDHNTALRLKGVPSGWLARGKGGLSTVDALMGLVGGLPDLQWLAVGAWGRKGQKLLALGSVVDTLLEKATAKTSMVLVKSGADALGENQPASFLCATDDSANSWAAFQAALPLLKGGDNIHVVYATSQDADERVMKRYKEAIEQSGHNGGAAVLHVNVGENVGDRIVSHAESEAINAHFIVVGHAPKTSVGSVAKRIAEAASVSVIVVKAHEA